MNWKTNRRAGLAVAFSAVLAAAGYARAEKPAATAPPLPTGRSIDAGSALTSQKVGSMPQSMAISPDGKYVVTTGNGYTEVLCSVRISDGKAVSTITFAKDQGPQHNGLYYGIALGSDGKIYAAQGAARQVTVYKIDAAGVLSHDGDITGNSTDFPAGVAADQRGRIYVTQNDPTHSKAVLFGTPASVAIYDTATKKEIGRFVFADPVGLSNFPLAIAANDDGSRVYVGSQRDDAVYVLDASDPAHVKQTARLSTGSHPTALLLNRARTRLYVANTQSDTVSVVDTASNAIVGTVMLRPRIASRLAGASPTGLALSADEDTLYASLGDMNAVAVIDVDDPTPALKGFIPAGWYPTAVAVAGDELLVTNAKGDLPRTPHDFSSEKKVTSPLYLLQGTLWKIAIPDADHLAKLTEECLQNARLTPKYLNGENPLESISIKSGRIKHVIYIIKENRTYDQILGDLSQGNGDLNRNLFGRDVTPNQHALAERFVLFDNFYDSGDVSGDGWTWSTQAQANEYTIRNVPYQYSLRGRTFDYEGSNNNYPTGGLPATNPDGKPVSDDPRFKEGIPPAADVAEAPGGHIWDMARKAGLTYRNYGFFMTVGVVDKGKTIIPDNLPAVASLQPAGHDLAGVTDWDFRRFDLDFPDSDAPNFFAQKNGDRKLFWKESVYGVHKLPSRFAEWKHEFDRMLAEDPSGNSVPQFMTIRLGTDHTQAAKSNCPTPSCMVADNDYAVGELVQAVSESAIWKSTAVVIVEDDAQNGPDHVDMHRSTCFVASPWIKKGSVDHSFQSTVSLMKTLECLMNLPPMCQYDAASDCLMDWDSSPANDTAFAAIMPSEKIMRERNPAARNGAGEQSPELPTNRDTTEPTAPSASNADLDSPAALAAASDAMNFSKADQVPAELLDRVIWKTVRGPKSEAPPTPRDISLGTAVEKDED